MKWIEGRKFITNISAIVLGVSVILTGGLSCTNGALAQQKIKLSFAHIGPSSGPLIANAFGPFARELEATGKVEFTYYGSGSSYSNPLKFPELVEQGVVDMAYGAHQLNAGQFPLNLLILEPFLISDPVKASRSFMKLVRTVPELKAEYGRAHVMTVNVTPHEAIHSLTPIRTADDLKGKRVLGSHPGGNDVLRALGASVVVLPSAAQYENLQKGVVDASASTMTSVAAFKLAEVTKYHMTWNVGLASGYTIMNKEKYDSLPADIKSIIDKYSTDDAAEAVSKAWSISDDAGIKQIKDSGGEIYAMPTAEIAALKQRLQSMLDGRIGKNATTRRVYDIIAKTIAEDAK
jgi:TRAP-type transport system periplasmic protein